MALCLPVHLFILSRASSLDLPCGGSAAAMIPGGKWPPGSDSRNWGTTYHAKTTRERAAGVCGHESAGLSLFMVEGCHVVEKFPYGR